MGSSALEEAVRSGSAGERERWGAGALGSGGASGQEASSLRRHGTLRGGLRPRFMRLGGVRLGGVRGAWSLAWRPALAPALGGGPGNLAPGTWRRESGAGNLAPGRGGLAGSGGREGRLSRREVHLWEPPARPAQPCRPCRRRSRRAPPRQDGLSLRSGMWHEQGQAT
jgi:hypothetical protein